MNLAKMNKSMENGVEDDEDVEVNIPPPPNVEDCDDDSDEDIKMDVDGGWNITMDVIGMLFILLLIGYTRKYFLL